ncbi:MAG: MFS transporter, partial [Chloroherpetonaceae bacterium]
VLISPYWLISTYFLLTIAELFLSPMGISFVSRVAPPKYKGLMQGGWLAATAIGNYAVAIIGSFWDAIPLWAFWLILVVCCMLSAAFIFSILKRLETATN